MEFVTPVPVWDAYIILLNTYYNLFQNLFSTYETKSYLQSILDN